jgi:hypothetical protein
MILLWLLQLQVTLHTLHTHPDVRLRVECEEWTRSWRAVKREIET